MAEVLHLSTPGFQLTVVELDPRRATIRAAGELDLAAREPLAELLQQQQMAGRRVISLDFSEVTFLDSSCVCVLWRRPPPPRACGLLVLHDVDARIARTLRVTGKEDCLFIAPTHARPSRPRPS